MDTVWLFQLVETHANTAWPSTLLLMCTEAEWLGAAWAHVTVRHSGDVDRWRNLVACRVLVTEAWLESVVMHSYHWEGGTRYRPVPRETALGFLRGRSRGGDPDLHGVYVLSEDGGSVQA